LTTLAQIAKLIRSKNAGPFELTIDVIFGDLETMQWVVGSKVLSAERIADLYRVPVEDIRVFHYEAGLAIKISFPRPIPSGNLGDTDVTGGQQYAPLVDLEVPDPTPKDAVG
jgi:Domain of unknown function (DUF4387)